MNLKPTI